MITAQVNTEKAPSFESVLGRAKLNPNDMSYQQKAANTLIKTSNMIFRNMLNEPDLNHNRDILLNAPTGSGKTIITGGYLDTMFYQHDKIVALWISETPNLTRQSIDSLNKHFDLDTKFYGEDINTEFENKTVIGINWEKIKNTKARNDTESTVSIDTLVADAQNKGTKVILIIDEAHSHASSKKSKEFLEIIGADIVVNVTATPEENYSYTIEVDIADVQTAGFIKQGVVINDLSDNYDDNYRSQHAVDNITQYFLRESLQKRDDLQSKVNHYTSTVATDKEPFVPLLVVQLPNNSDDLMNAVESYIKTLGHDRDNGELAVYTADDYTDELDVIGKDQNVKVLLFKQAISKGWDCPRASIITLLRDPKKHTFVKQTIGRILRMPYLEAYPQHDFDELNYGYVFIEETENKVLQEVTNDIKQSGVPNTLHRRPNLNTELNLLLKQVWQNQSSGQKPNKRAQSLQNSLDHKIKYNKGFDYITQHQGPVPDIVRDISTGQISTADLSASGEIVLDQATDETQSKQFNLSDYDVLQEAVKIANKSKLSNDDVFDVFAATLLTEYNQNNPANTINEYDMYRLITHYAEDFIGDMQRIQDAVLDSIQDHFIKVLKEWHIPEMWVVPTDAKDRPNSMAAKTPYNELWMTQNSLEKGFAELLAKDPGVLLWHKNGDNGEKHFSIAYNKDTSRHHFYPDFLVETKDSIYVLETKGQNEGETNIEKERSLESYRKALINDVDFKDKPTKQLILGYVKRDNDIFYRYTGTNFEKEHDTMTNWVRVKF